MAVVWRREGFGALVTGEAVIFKETYIVARCPAAEPVRDGWEDYEHDLVDDLRWWTLEELRACAEPICCLASSVTTCMNSPSSVALSLIVSTGGLSVVCRTRFLLRFPDAAPRKPLHDSLGRLPLNLPERRQQFFLRGRTECCRCTVDHDGPVNVARWHGQMRSCRERKYRTLQKLQPLFASTARDLPQA